jgi:copper chaperone
LAPSAIDTRDDKEGRFMTQPTTERVTLLAPDISCGHCVNTVQSSVGKLEGVKRVSASAETKQVDLEFDPSLVSLAQIEAVLDDEGYPVKR